MDWRLELVIIPVSDVEKAKAFYSEQVGFIVDVDHQPNDAFRIVQLTPPGSACSSTIGKGMQQATPGSAQGMHLIVDDIEAACAELEARGVEMGMLHHFADGVQTPGVDPNRQDYGSFSSFNDPDGNTWVIQEVASRGKQ